MAIIMKPMLTQVLEDLAACKGKWVEIARELEPGNTVSFYSWLTKLAQGVIREPSVNKIQRLYDYFRVRAEQASCVAKANEAEGELPSVSLATNAPAVAVDPCSPSAAHDERRGDDRRGTDRRNQGEQRATDRRATDRRAGTGAA